MLDQALKECTRRYVGGKPLIALDQVKFQISKIQSAFTICSGMCYRSAEYSSIKNNLAADIVEANSIKTYVTDLMQESSQTLTQLCGANGYNIENVGARGIIDSRPFQIFEGSNEMLYTQIGEAVLKMAKRKSITNFYRFLSEFNLTKDGIDHFKGNLDFNIDGALSQRKIVDLGKVISRIVCANHVVNLGRKGFRPDLIRDCLETVKHEVNCILCSYNNHNLTAPLEDYAENSSWSKLI